MLRLLYLRLSGLITRLLGLLGECSNGNMFLVDGVVLLMATVALCESSRFHTRLTLSLILCPFIFLLPLASLHLAFFVHWF
jgi:hypothetical protein